MAKNDYEGMNLYQKLAAIRKQVAVIQKNKDGYGYKYVSEDEILAKVTGLMDKMGILLMPSIPTRGFTIKDGEKEHDERYESIWVNGEDIVTKKKNKKTGEIEEEQKWEAVVYGPMQYTWVNTEKPEERIEVPWFFVGQQSDASQAFGSGLTYCNRYFLLKFFNIATVEDDPDSWRTKQKNAEKEEDTLIAKEIISEVDKLAKQFVAEAKKPDDAKKKLLEITSKFVKGGNYTKITEPALATRLLADIKELVGVKEE